MTNKNAVRHTPGPWRYDSFGNLYGPNEKLIFNQKGPTTEANAHLIASAPSMKYALEFILCHHDDPEAWPEALENVREALKEAEGRK